jgi:hypothetical protein
VALISLSHQGSHCLSTDFPTCGRFPAEAPVIDVGPRAVPVPPTTDEAAAPTITRRGRWRVAFGVLFLLVLLAAILLVVAIVGLSGVAAA